MNQLKKTLLREIPAVSELLAHPQIRELTVPLQRVTAAIQTVLTGIRQAILSDDGQTKPPLQLDAIVQDVLKLVSNQFSPSLKKVINATGVVLHTNCGRSPLHPEVLEFMNLTSAGYSNLELDLQTGRRGSRYTHVEELVCKLTGAEAAMAVNNNAAAVLLVMHALAQDKDVIVSRGELVEVGGSFRIPEVLKAGGARLIEVGTTNKTWLRDYAAAVTENTALLLKVHTSNFRVIGFTQSVTSQELVEMAHAQGLIVVEDLGSGTLADVGQFGLPYEPTVQDVVDAGVDLVTFSGDKLLGGPQAGIIAGKRKLIERLRTDQLTRALRIDKLTLAALEATLRIYLAERYQEIPTIAMLSLGQTELAERARNLAELLKGETGTAADISVEKGYSQVGGGSLPTAKPETYVVAVKPHLTSVSALEKFIRTNDHPVLAYVQNDKLMLDVRTLLPGDMEQIGAVFKAWTEEIKTQYTVKIDED
ncbi:MAG TPA: L-seryl-tRNA(Sec) selenium transferase [Desulfobacteria bacterium]|nr:L-seryl-tRNA(Sec) selenium transferase [Desulfobacteria bacterium]